MCAKIIVFVCRSWTETSILLVLLHEGIMHTWAFTTKGSTALYVCVSGLIFNAMHRLFCWPWRERPIGLSSVFTSAGSVL